MNKKRTKKTKRQNTIIDESKNVPKITFLQKIIPPSILAILTAIFYYPSLKYPFQFDDIANITKRFYIRSDNPIYRWHHNPRWLGDFLSMINYKIGKFDPFSYRLFNLLIHITTGIVLFYLILTLCRCLKSKSFFLNNAIYISSITTALFLLHPVQTQTISYVMQARLEGLAGLFIISTILIFVRILLAKNLITKIALTPLALLTTILSYGTKEIMIVMPFLLIMTDWFFVSEGKWQNFKQRFWYYLVFFVLFMIIFIKYVPSDLIKRVLTLKFSVSNNRGNVLTTNAYDTITASMFLISSFKVILHYYLIFLWPFNLSVEYDWKMSNSFFATDAFFPFLILMAMLTYAIYITIKNKNSFISFSILWFFISVIPRASIIPSGELICDYKTYLASAGWLFLISIGLVYISKKIIKNIQNIPKWLFMPQAQVAFLTILALPLGAATLVRNKVWSSPENFWGDIVKKAPLKARGHNNYGVALAEAGKTDEAIYHYKKAIALDKYYADPLSNISVSYSVKGKIDDAINALKAAINLHSNYPEAYNNLGTLFLKKKNYEDAEKALDVAIQLRPYYGKAFYNKGRLYIEKGDEEKAWQYFKKATEGDLDIAEGFHTLGQMSLRLRKFDEAEKAFEKVLSCGMSNPNILFNLANACFMNKKTDKAIAIYKKLQQDNPLEVKYIYNLAEALYTKNNYQEALQLFQKVTSLSNQLPQAHFRIANCLEKLEKIDDATNYLERLTNAQASDQFKQVAISELNRVKKLTNSA